MLIEDYGSLLNLENLAEVLSVEKATAAKLCREKKIKAFKCGREWRIPKVALEEYILTESKAFKANQRSNRK